VPCKPELYISSQVVNSKIAPHPSSMKTDINVFFSKVPMHSTSNVACRFRCICLIGLPSESFAVQICSKLVSKASSVRKAHGGVCMGLIIVVPALLTLWKILKALWYFSNCFIGTLEVKRSFEMESVGVDCTSVLPLPSKVGHTPTFIVPRGTHEPQGGGIDLPITHDMVAEVEFLECPIIPPPSMPESPLVQQIVFETMPRSDISQPEYSIGMIEASHDFNPENEEIGGGRGG